MRTTEAWIDSESVAPPRMSLAVRAAVTSAKSNPYGAGRYGPDAKDADTSVSGAVMMGLLAARNAGIEVPDETITRAIRHVVSMTGPMARWAIRAAPVGVAMPSHALPSSSKPSLASHGGSGGTVDTALALLALAVNYKYLPVYE